MVAPLGTRMAGDDLARLDECTAEQAGNHGLGHDTGADGRDRAIGEGRHGAEYRTTRRANRRPCSAARGAGRILARRAYVTSFAACLGSTAAQALESAGNSRPASKDVWFDARLARCARGTRTDRPRTWLGRAKPCSSPERKTGPLS